MKPFYLLSVFLFVTGFVFGQKPFKIPRKFRGNYTGTQPEYMVQNANVTLEIPAVEMKLVLDKTTVTLCYTLTEDCFVSKQTIANFQKIKSPKKSLWIFEPKAPGATVAEHLTLDVKNKKITRQGLGTQPDTELVRVRKKQ